MNSDVTSSQSDSDAQPQAEATVSACPDDTSARPLGQGISDLGPDLGARKHYSVTQINMYLRCPAQYSYRYMHGLKEAPSSALVQGKSFHRGLELNYEQKITTKVDLPLDEVQDAYSTHFDTHILEVEEKDR